MLVTLTATTILVYALLAGMVGLVVYRWRALFLRGVPELSATGLSLFRVALGVALFWAMAVSLRLPDVVAPGGPESEAALWQPWSWVDYLAGHWNLRDAIQMATLVAIVAFAAGLYARTAYLLVAAGFLVRLLVLQEYGVGSHAWVILPLALAPLVIVPWGEGLSIDNLFRRWRGRPSRVRPLGAHYGLAIWVPGLVLSSALFAAAASKLAESGTEWVTGGAVRYHWAEDHLSAPVSWGAWIAAHEDLSILLSAVGVAVEALFLTHLFFRSQWIRASYGLAAMSLLLGFYAFQGVFWFAWWLLLLAFVPWEAIAGLVRRVARLSINADEPVTHAVSINNAPRWYGGIAVITAVVCVQQLAISRADVEQMPFFSNYPMYSGTWDSPDAFNEGLAPVKFYRYDYLTRDTGGQFKNISGRVLSAGIDSALRDAVLAQLRYPDEPLEPSTRELLVKAEADYEEQFGSPLIEVRIVAHAREFDFEHGGLRRRRDPPAITVDLQTLTVG
ncbi:MAG: hypothetical protein H0T43_02135 [Solirubrobacterales bacterium]|nr:hypothetical protein [Solirubrobacterales bacterium]